jgi:predicted transcriptional regulator
MKTATLPSIRVEPELREQLESALTEGETVSSFVEQSVRDALRWRIDQAAFVARGAASIERARVTGDTVSAEDVLSKMRALREAAEKRIAARQHSSS